MAKYDFSKLFRSPKATQEEMELIKDVAAGMGKSGKEAVEESAAIAKQQDLLNLLPEQQALPMLDNSFDNLPEIIEARRSLSGPVSSNLPEVLEARQLRATSSVDPNIIDAEVVKKSKLDELSGLLDKYKKPIIGAAGIGTAASLMSGSSPSNKEAPLTTPPEAPKAEQAAPVQPNAQQKLPSPGEVQKAQAQNDAEIEQKLMEINFGENAIESTEELRALQKERNELRLLSGLTQSFEKISNSIIGGKQDGSNEKFWEQHNKNLDNPINDYKEQVAFQKEDPSSPVSQGYRELLKSMGFNITGQASAADLDKLYPQLANVFNQREARAARKEQQKEMALLKSESNKEKADLKTRGEQDKFIERASARLIKGTESYSKIKRASAMIDEAVKNPSGIKDVTSLYSLISALDPTSVVREGEIALAKQAGGLMGRVQVGLSQLSTNPRLINKKSLTEIQQAIKQLESLSDQEYDYKRGLFLNQAKARGITEDRFEEIDPFYAKGAKFSLPLDDNKKPQSGAKEKAVSAQPDKLVVKKGYNPKTDQTQLVYSDGTKEIVSGRK